MRNLYKSKLFWLGIVISGVFFYLAARQVSVADLSASLSNANYYWLLPVIVILFLNYAIMATRWRYIIKAGADVPFGATFSMLMVGLFVNNVLPLRLGELLRAHMLGKKQGLSRSFSLATIAADRLFDVITLLLMFSIASLAVPLPIWAKTIGILASALLVIGAVLLVLIAVKGKTIVSSLGKLIPFVSKDRLEALSLRVELFSEGLLILRKVRYIARVLALSILYWIVFVVMFRLILASFHINIPALGIVLLLSVSTLGTMIPSAPGYIGSYQFLLVSTLSLFGVDKSLALSFALVSHSVWYLPVTALGLFMFWKEDLSISRLPTSQEGSA